MADRSLDKVARELSSDFQALRNDLRKLTGVVSSLANDQADNTRSSFASVVDRARDRFSDTSDHFASQANYAGDRLRGAQAEIETRIGRNPMTAVMIAVVGGLLIGALSRTRR